MENAERLARDLLDKVQRGRLTEADLAAARLSLDGLRSFIRGVDRARSAMTTTPGGNSTAPPTFADFIKDFDRSARTGTKAASGGGTATSSKEEGKGSLRGVAEGLKETVDPEYQDLLEEYYRSLAAPAPKRAKK